MIITEKKGLNAAHISSYTYAFTCTETFPATPTAVILHSLNQEPDSGSGEGCYCIDKHNSERYLAPALPPFF